jgi:hypothetical protein
LFLILSFGLLASSFLQLDLKTSSAEGKVSNKWSTYLSPYWSARAYAHLGGYDFTLVDDHFGDGTWLQYLPTAVSASNLGIGDGSRRRSSSSYDEFEHFCTVCGPFFEERSSSTSSQDVCFGGWTGIVPTIQKETQAAIMQYSQVTNTSLPTFTTADDDISSSSSSSSLLAYFFAPKKENVNHFLLHSSCEICTHSSQGPYKFSLLELALPPSGRTVLHYFEETGGACAAISLARIDYIKEHYSNVEFRPRATAKRKTGTSSSTSTSKRLFDDFAAMVLAPNVIVGSAGSSWAHWSAVVGNSGNVFIGSSDDGSGGMGVERLDGYENIHLTGTRAMVGEECDGDVSLDGMLKFLMSEDEGEGEEERREEESERR